MASQHDTNYFNEQTERMKRLTLKAVEENKSVFDIMKEENESYPYVMHVPRQNFFGTCTDERSKTVLPSYEIDEVYTKLDAKTIAALNNIESYQERFMKELHEKFKAVCIANPGKKFTLKWSDMDWPPVQKQNSFHAGLTVQIVEVP